MLNTIKTLKTFRYLNNFFMYTFLNLSIKCGNSKSFKKKYIRLMFNRYRLDNYNLVNLNLNLNSLIKQYLNFKYCNVILFNKSTITYVNHKKKILQNIGLSLLKKNNSYFFIKYTKYIYMKKNWKKNVDNFIKSELISNKSSTYSIFFLIFKVLVKRKKNKKN